MKQLSIEEKAKAYDEAFEIARLVLQERGNEPDGASILSELFPELAESEDERIRKEIIDFATKVKNGLTSILVNNYDFNKWIIWLEKQGKQPKKHDVCDYCDQQGSCVSPCSIKLVEKQGEQKQPKELTNSEFVEKCKGLSRLEQHILALVPTRPIDAIKVDARTIRYLVEQEQGEQKPAWSEKDVDCRTTGYWVVSPVEERQDNSEIEPLEPWSDDQIINYIITLLRNNNVNNKESKGINESIEIWLKSLRPQTTWKPSEEQMKAFEYCIDNNCCDKDGVNGSKMVELYQQLKAL